MHDSLNDVYVLVCIKTNKFSVHNIMLCMCALIYTDVYLHESEKDSKMFLLDLDQKVA